MQWFRNLNTMAKLMLSFGALLVITIVIGVSGISRMRGLNQAVETTYSRDLLGLVAVKDVEVAKMDAARCSRNAILAIGNKKAIEDEEHKLDGIMSDLKEKLAKAEATCASEAAKAEIAKIRELLPNYESGNNQVFVRAKAGDTKGAKAALQANSEVIASLNKAVRELAAIKLAQAQANRDESNKSYQSSSTTMICMVGGAIFLGLILSVRISLFFARPLNAAVQVLRKVAAGDLTQKVDFQSRDELGMMGAALNEAVESMRRALSEVGDASSNLNAVSQELASASGTMAEGAQKQAASLEQTSASLEEITATVRQNADSAKQASQLASASRQVAEKGGDAVVAAVSAMSEINAASSKIADIIGTIDEIAFQTNLLAVNAAVEAARAGEQGRGFAVVASEVRNLAQRSAGAAKEIKSLISDSLRKIENGSELVNRSGNTLQEIVASVKRVSDIVGEIAVASNEQSVGIEQVNKAMMQMDQVTQGNSAQTEELSATAEALSEQAKHLQQLVSRFQISLKERKSSVPGYRKSAVASVPSSEESAGRHSMAVHPAYANSSTVPADLGNLARGVTGHSQEVSDEEAFEEF